MADYELYYWAAPFRGQFVRAVLAIAGEAWTEPGDAAVAALMQGSIGEMPVPFMGPPVLVDRRQGVVLSQMAAIILYLGETHGLLPADAGLRALNLKVVLDANDVIDELTLDGGRQMWTDERWRSFMPRLKKWMSLWEETGRRHGLTDEDGFLLGGETLSTADIVTAVLWSTIADRFRPIAALFEETAPTTAVLSRRVSGLPPLAGLAAKAREDWGEAWCGGQIEASLRKVLNG
jgi:glutathione S-transferase